MPGGREIRGFVHLNLGILASGRGSNMQAVIDACKRGTLDAEIRVVISNNPDAGALEKARAEGIPAVRLSSRTHPGADDLDRAICRTLQEKQVEWVVLAGYMKKLGPVTLDAYRGRILNNHTALLPEFGGPGMYGERVHQAVLDAGERTSGVSIHLVDEEYDHGDVVAQATVPVHDTDTAQALANRVLGQEHLLLVDTLRRIAAGDLVLPKPG